MIPGGVGNPGPAAGDEKVVRFARDFFEQGKPVAAICHGPWVLVEAGVVRGRTVTSWPSLRTDIRNAGGEWVDREVVVDQGLVTSRKPDDIPAFNRQDDRGVRRGGARPAAGVDALAAHLSTRETSGAEKERDREAEAGCEEHAGGDEES